MKSLKLISILVLGLLSYHYSNAQETQSVDTLSFKVNGVCEMCKERIENAALIKGVKFTEWNKVTKDLMVIYKPEKVNELELHNAVAEFGHDTEKVKAKDENYAKLPFCCEYREGQESH
ncbi:MAG: heavy-metal-associated domain-containing protein [Bacteroidota bacterium]